MCERFGGIRCVDGGGCDGGILESYGGPVGGGAPVDFGADESAGVFETDAGGCVDAGLVDCSGSGVMIMSDQSVDQRVVLRIGSVPIPVVCCSFS